MTMKGKLRQARPNLSLVAPLTHKICWGFAIANILLSIVIITDYLPVISRIPILSVVTNPITGFIFFLIGVALAYGLVVNEWKLVRYALVAGILLKTYFLVALILWLFMGGSPILLIIWAFFTYIQFITYIYFAPPISRRHNDSGDVV